LNLVEGEVDFRDLRGLFIDDVDQFRGVQQLALQLVDGVDPLVVAGDFLQNFLRLLIVIPESGLYCPGFEFRYSCLSLCEVKDTSLVYRVDFSTAVSGFSAQS